MIARLGVFFAGIAGALKAILPMLMLIVAGND
jgi:hypothetical protein